VTRVSRGLGLVALVLVLAVTVSVPAAASAASKPVEVGSRQLHDSDVEVFMEVRATPGQIARVRRAIERSDAAERFAFLDKHDAYRVFSQIFHDDPNLVKNTDSAVLPTSFRVDLASSDDRFPFRQQFEALPGVDTVEIALTDEEEQVQRDAGARRKLCDAEADAEVFMVVRSSPAQEQTVADALASTKGVLSARRISHDEALTTFNCIFADHPEVLAGVTAESLPVSFRLEVANAAALGRVFRNIGKLPGVDEIKD
jgi:cell division protein FtsX